MIMNLISLLYMYPVGKIFSKINIEEDLEELCRIMLEMALLADIVMEGACTI